MPPSQERNDATGLDRFPATLSPGLLSHLTRLTRLRLWGVYLPDDPDVLPSAGASLRVLELMCDGEDEGEAAIEALLPVAAGLDALDIHISRLTAADAARLAAALPRDMARMRVSNRRNSDPRVWSALPITDLFLREPPADLALLAGASGLEQLDVIYVWDVEPAALAAALQALPRLRALELNNGGFRAFEPDAPGHAPPDDAVDAFVAAVAGLPSLRDLSLAGFHVGPRAEAALMQAAPRLSSLYLSVCGWTDEAADGLEGRLSAAAGRGVLLYLCVDVWAPYG
jgi:hypothetical protein